MTRLVAQQPPTSTWVPPNEVIAEITGWLNLASYVVSGLSVLAVMIFGALLVADRDRGEPVSATAPHMRGLQIAIGVFIISGAGSLATWLVA